MSVLCDWEIRHVRNGHPSLISPWDEASLQPDSYDLHLFPVLLNRKGRKYIIPPEGLLLYFGEFRLGSTVEYIQMDLDLVAKVEGKSTRAREALTVQAAGHVDAGFEGNLTLELSQTDKDEPTLLLPGMAIAQLVFYRSEIPERPYGRGGVGHYQEQVGPTLSWEEGRR